MPKQSLTKRTMVRIYNKMVVRWQQLCYRFHGGLEFWRTTGHHSGSTLDRAVEDALTNSPRMLVILSPASVSSTNVMDEVSFALEEQKTVIPVIHRDCTVPFRLRRVQHVDFRQDYARGLQELLKTLALGQEAGQS
jgi:TIR domain